MVYVRNKGERFYKPPIMVDYRLTPVVNLFYLPRDFDERIYHD